MSNGLSRVAAKSVSKVAAATARLKGMTGVFKTLVEQHREASALLEDVMAAEDPEERAELWPQVRRELLSHERAEMEVVYTAVDRVGEGSITRKHAAGATDLERRILEIDAIPFTSDTWLSAIDDLARAVAWHADEEESHFFPRAQRMLAKSETKELDDHFKEAKRAHMEAEAL